MIPKDLKIPDGYEIVTSGKILPGDLTYHVDFDGGSPWNPPSKGSISIENFICVIRKKKQNKLRIQ